MEWPWQLPTRGLPMTQGAQGACPNLSFSSSAYSWDASSAHHSQGSTNRSRRSMCIYTLHHLTSDAFMSLNFTKICSHILDLPSSCFSPFLFQFVPLLPHVVKCFYEFAYSQARCHTGQAAWSAWSRVSGLASYFLNSGPFTLNPFLLPKP